MAENIKQLKTKIALKILPYSEWDKIKDSYKPLRGEVCLCEIPAPDATGHTEATTAPTVLFKVGDGTNFFGALKWASALAADVYEWAKAPTKPTYAASEITGLDEYIAGEIQDTNTDTQYRFAVENNALSVYKTVYTLGIAGTEEKVGSYDFVTSDELTEILKDYYTKKEVDDKIGAANETVYDETMSKYPVGTGIYANVYTRAQADHRHDTLAQAHSALQQQIDNLNTGVMSVTAGDDTITIDGDGKNVTVAVTPETFDAYGAAGNVKTGVENGTIKAKTAEHADAAGKVDNALTVKVGGEDVIYDGSEAKTADVDAAIAAAIEAEGHPEYSIAKVATTTGYSATYQLTKDGTAVGAKIDIPKDMVVSKGEVITYENAGAWGNAGTYIVLTLANATNDTLYIPAAGLIEYVTSGSTADSQVIVNIDENHKVTATIGAGKVTATELAQAVNNDIAKGVEAHGWGDHAAEGYLKATDIANKMDKVHGAQVDYIAIFDDNGNVKGSADTIDSVIRTAEAGAKTETANQIKALALGTMSKETATDYVKKSEAEGYADILTKTAAQGLYQPKGDYASADQGGKADTALQEIEAGLGLTVSTKKDNKQKIEIDDDVIFVLNANF